MRLMTASHAKQNFGELIDATAAGPIAIERHKKIRAIVCSPEAFSADADRNGRLAERHAARAAQALIEKDRLIKHQRMAIELLVATPALSKKLVSRAQQEVQRWRRERLCSDDYSDRWEALLLLPLSDLARAMGSDQLEWGAALRQNSPWHVVSA